MNSLIVAVIVLGLTGCGSDENTYVSHALGESNETQGMYVDDVNVSDITSIHNVDNITVTDNGMFILCTEGSTCTVTTNIGDESSDMITTTTVDNNSSQG